MCNTVLIACGRSSVNTSYLNDTPSLRLSSMLYGNWGAFSHGKAAYNLMQKLKSKYGDLLESGNTEELMKRISADDELNVILHEPEEALKRYLKNGIEPDERAEIITSVCEKIIDIEDRVTFREDNRFKEIADTDKKLLKRKWGLDNELIRNQVSEGRYAEDVNELARELANRYCEVFETDVIGESIASVNIINPEFMKDVQYDELKKDLGIN